MAKIPHSNIYNVRGRRGPNGNIHFYGTSTGEWYLEGAPSANRRTTGILNRRHVLWQHPDYIPWQSMYDPFGQHAYQGQLFPTYAPGRGRYLIGWERTFRRPDSAHSYRTVPLGVYSCDNQPGYDWSWWNNGRYIPPDVEYDSE